MKILLTINTSWNIYNFRLGLIMHLQKSGHELIALAPEDEFSLLLEKEGVRFYNLLINPKSTNPLHDLELLQNYYKKLKAIKPDIVLSYTIKPNIYASMACRRLNIPIINNVSGLGTVFIKRSTTSTIAKRLYRTAFKKSAWIFFQNQSDRELFEAFKLIPADRSSVVPGSGVNLDKFNFNRKQNKGNRFLFVGRLLGDKGVRELIAAFNRLSSEYKDIELYLVGELGYNNRTAINKQELDNFLQNSQIKYLGKSDNVASVFKQANVMVFPSYREGLSRSLIEAAAMQLPIITTDVPGCREVVENGKNGFLCAVRDSHDLYLRMKDIATITEDTRLAMGKYGRRKVENEFDEKIVIRKYIDKIKAIKKY